MCTVALQGRSQIAQLLVSAKADLGFTPHKPLPFDIDKFHHSPRDEVHSPLDEGFVGGQFHQYAAAPPLWIAARAGHAKVVQVLLEGE